MWTVSVCGIPAQILRASYQVAEGVAARLRLVLQTSLDLTRSLIHFVPLALDTEYLGC